MATTIASTTATDPLDEPLPGERLVLAAALGAAVAGVIHLAVVPGHWSESGPMSAFFIGVGLAQLVLAGALGRGLRDSVLVAVITVHLAIMGMYVASRTVDLPFVPPHDAAHRMDHLPVPRAVGDGIPVYPGSRVEPVGALDLLCLVAEVVLVVSVAALLTPRLRGTVTTLMALAAVGAVLWRVWVLA